MQMLMDDRYTDQFTGDAFDPINRQFAKTLDQYVYEGAGGRGEKSNKMFIVLDRVFQIFCIVILCQLGRLTVRIIRTCTMMVFRGRKGDRVKACRI